MVKAAVDAKRVQKTVADIEAEMDSLTTQKVAATLRLNADNTKLKRAVASGDSAAIEEAAARKLQSTWRGNVAKKAMVLKREEIEATKREEAALAEAARVKGTSEAKAAEAKAAAEKAAAEAKRADKKGGVFGEMSNAMEEDSAPPADEAAAEPETKKAKEAVESSEVTPFGTDGLPAGEMRSQSMLTLSFFHRLYTRPLRNWSSRQAMLHHGTLALHGTRRTARHTTPHALHTYIRVLTFATNLDPTRHADVVAKLAGSITAEMRELLPKSLIESITSDKFIAEADGRFDKLDVNNNDALENSEVSCFGLSTLLFDLLRCTTLVVGIVTPLGMNQNLQARIYPAQLSFCHDRSPTSFSLLSSSPHPASPFSLLP